MAAAPLRAQAAPAARPVRVRAWLKRLHLWFGLSAGLAFALVALSGTVLAFQRELLLRQHPELRRPLPDRAQLAAVLDTLGGAARPAGLTALDLPTPALPVWQLYFADGARRYLDPQTGALLLTRTPSNDALLWLRELHTHLLAGARGEQVLGGVGLLALLLLLSGLWLWWPRRGALLASLRPHAQPPTRRWLSWHRSLGALALPLLLTVTATGTAMVYHAPTRTALHAAFADAPQPAPPPLLAPQARPFDWNATLAAAEAALPGAALHRLVLPGARDAKVAIRAQAAGEWHPVGRSVIWLDPYRGRVLGVHDATRQGTGARWSDNVYPLHMGAAGGGAWRALVALAGLLPSLLLVSGFLFWRARKRAV